MSRLVEELQVPLDTLRAQYENVFGIVVPKDCPPYETEYYPSQDTFGRSQQLADVAGFYRAFGIELRNRFENGRTTWLSSWSSWRSSCSRNG